MIILAVLFVLPVLYFTDTAARHWKEEKGRIDEK
jgi:hypothetical protein